MKSLTLFLISILIIFQISNLDYKKWSKIEKLTWEDFQKVDSSKSISEAANVYCEINYSFSSIGNKVYFISYSQVKISESWVVKTEMNDYLLNHEQRHFDLTELYCRKFKSEIFKLNEKNIHYRQLSTQIDSVYIGIMKKFQEAHNQYDKTTNHSLNKRKQHEWNIYIDNQLKKYCDFEEDTVEIALLY